MLDSSGSYAGGLFYGQNFRPSNPNECYLLNDELNDLIAQQDAVNGLANASSVVPFFVQIVVATYTTSIDNLVTSLDQ